MLRFRCSYSGGEGSYFHWYRRHYRSCRACSSTYKSRLKQLEGEQATLTQQLQATDQGTRAHMILSTRAVLNASVGNGSRVYT